MGDWDSGHVDGGAERYLGLGPAPAQNNSEPVQALCSGTGFLLLFEYLKADARHGTGEPTSEGVW